MELNWIKGHEIFYRSNDTGMSFDPIMSSQLHLIINGHSLSVGHSSKYLAKTQ